MSDTPNCSLILDIVEEGAVGGEYVEESTTITEDHSDEGAVAVSPPGFLIIPSTPGGRRASVVSCDGRNNPQSQDQPPVKVAVFGKDGVGKSALIVRLLTGRFIGEYDPSMEAVFHYTLPFPGHEVPLQIMDTAGQVELQDEGRGEQISWGNGFLLVFSLTSHKSFMDLHHIRRVILEVTPGSPGPMVLVGNKADLTHAREVTPGEIKSISDVWGCDYFEVSAAEPWDVVVRPFLALYEAVLERRGSTSLSY